jgi:hypothetical protein
MGGCLPPSQISGACLYDWRRDHEVLYEGDCDLRVRTDFLAEARNRALVPLWDKYLQEARARQSHCILV